MKKPVYDIVNAGPKHRFTANGKLVSNCGRLTQIQNYPRPTLSDEIIREGIEVVRRNDFESTYEVLEISDVPLMELCSSALRYSITAAPGKKLIVADLANIEGRVLAYLAGETWKLKAFRDYDTFQKDDIGTVILDKKGKPVRCGPDLYIASYAKSFSVDIASVTKENRQIGKILELALGYSGGCGAIVAFATSFNIDLDELAGNILHNLPDHVLDEARSLYDWIVKQKKKSGDGEAAFGLSRDTFAAMDSLKRLWRSGHPAIVKFWADTEDAVRNAVAIPKKRFYFGNGLYAIRLGKWVRLVLPSGHSLCYPMMEVDGKGKLRFKGVGQYTKKWEWIHTYSGKLVENLTQAFARDIFKYGQLNAERAGYRVVMPVHDELVTEVPDTDEYSVHELERLMTISPPWLNGMPLAAEGFSDTRYHK